MALSRDEIYHKVQGVLVDALGVDEEDVKPNAGLVPDLGAESIDFLDIKFRLEKSFTTDPAKPFTIPNGELFPEDLGKVMSDETYVKDGRVTTAGIAELKTKLPFTDLTEFEKDPTVEKAMGIIDVNTVVNYVENKLKTAE